MYNQYENVLHGVLRYEQTQNSIIIISSILIFALVFFVAFKYTPKATTNKLIMYIVIAILVLSFIGYIIYYWVYTSNIEKDIEDKNYVVYSGTFTHDNFQKDSFYHNIYIFDDDGHKYRLNYPDYGNQYKTYRDFEILPFDTFNGTIVYSKNSRIVLKWTISNDE